MFFVGDCFLPQGYKQQRGKFFMYLGSLDLKKNLTINLERRKDGSMDHNLFKVHCHIWYQAKGVIISSISDKYGKRVQRSINSWELN